MSGSKNMVGPGKEKGPVAEKRHERRGVSTSKGILLSLMSLKDPK